MVISLPRYDSRQRPKGVPSQHRKSTWTFRRSALGSQRQWEKKMSKSVWNLVNEAFQRVYVHRGFDLPKYIASEERPSVNGVKEGKPYRPKIPEREVYIQHSRPLVGVDVNGILLYIVLPNFLSRAAHEEVRQAMRLLGGSGILTLDRVRGSALENFKMPCGPGQFAGTVNLATRWHALYQENVSDAVTSKPLATPGTCAKFEVVQQFLRNLNRTQIKINKVLSIVDPDVSHSLRSALELAKERSAGAAAASVNNRSHFMAVSAIFNYETPDHRDVRSMTRGYDALLASGAFHGGALHFREINTTVPFNPRTFIMLRGRCLFHAIRPFRGYRNSLAYFSNEAVMKELNVNVKMPEPSLPKGMGVGFEDV